MPTTPTYGLRSPALSDTPDVPRDIGNLATDVEAALTGLAALVPGAVWVASSETAGSVGQGSLTQVVAVTPTVKAGGTYLVSGTVTLKAHGAGGAYLASVVVGAHLRIGGGYAAQRILDASSGNITLPIDYVWRPGTGGPTEVRVDFRLDSAVPGGCIVLGGTVRVTEIRPQ